jgi:hypothetical protein
LAELQFANIAPLAPRLSRILIIRAHPELVSADLTAEHLDMLWRQATATRGKRFIGIAGSVPRSACDFLAAAPNWCQGNFLLGFFRTAGLLESTTLHLL